MSKLDKFDELSVTEQRIISEIKRDSIPAISESEISIACRLASSYYTEKQTPLDKNFWKVTLSCLSMESAFFWILSAFLLGSCVMLSILATGHGIDPIALMSALAPVPVIAFAIRELQYRDSNLVQIEKTCKYAPQKIYFARLWIGMFVNAFWVLIAGAIVFGQYENYVQLLFCSFIAMFLVGAIALTLMSVTNNTLPLSLLMTAWILSAVFLMSGEEFMHIITTMSVSLLIALTLFSLGLFAIVTVRTTAKLYA